MATISGFQANTTIHAAFWIYKPDVTVDPVSKEEFIEVNTLQRIEANPETILTSIASTSVTSNLLTVTCANAAQLRSQQQVILRGLSNIVALNGQVVTVLGVTPTTFTANFISPDYGTTPEPDGAQVVDTTNRTAYLFYPETDVSTSQAPKKIVGAVAARFIYDMEALFY